MQGRRFFLVAALVSAGLTSFLYGGALGLPFYSDDLLQVPWAQTASLWRLWSAAGPYGDYRPLHWMVWRLLCLLAGPLRPRLLHALNLAAHALCGTLVAALAMRGARNEEPGRRWPMALLAAAIFVACPFAFDAVIWVSAFSYPLTTALCLGALLMYLQARDAQRQGASWPLHLLAVGMTILAGLAYEGGVVTGLIVLWAEIMLLTPGPLRFAFCVPRSVVWPVFHVAASVAPLALIVIFSPPSTYSLGGTYIIENIIAALQACAFPVAPLVTRMLPWGLNPFVAMGCIGAATLLAAGYIARRSGRWRQFCFGMGWALVWGAVPIITLDFDWLRDPPRVFYPGAVGIALAWAQLIAGGRRQVARLSARRLVFNAGAALLLTAGCLLLPIISVRERMELVQRAGNLLWEVIHTAEGGKRTLFVNLPGRITLAERIYPLGHEGIVLLPPPVGANLLVQVHTGRTGLAFARTLGDILPALPYAVELMGAPLTLNDLRSAERVFIVEYAEQAFRLSEAGAIIPGQANSTWLARFENQEAGLILLSASCQRAGSDRVILSTDWQTQAAEPAAWTTLFFAHLEVDGALLAQADGEPLRGLYPFALWQPGERVRDVRVFENVPPGRASVTLGVWDPAMGIKWDAVGADGQAWPENVFHCEVQWP